MANVDTMGYSVEELQAIANSDSNDNTVDTQGYSVDELRSIAGQTDQPKNDLDLGKVGKSFMHGARPDNILGGGLFGGSSEAASEAYSQTKENLLNLLSAKGVLPDSVFGDKKVPIARTSASILTDILSGFAAETTVSGGRALLNNAKTALKNSGIDLSNKNQVDNIASGINKAYESVKSGFNKTYENIFSADKIIPESQKVNLGLEASDALTNVSQASPNYNFLDKKLTQIIDGGNVTGRDLHQLKPFVAKLGPAGSKLNSTINKILGGEDMYGKAYSSVTSSYDKFINTEAPYVEKLIMDSTAGQLTSEKLLTGNSNSLIRTPINLVKNQRTALKDLLGRVPESGDYVHLLDSLRKGTILKRVVGGTMAAGASLLYPPAKKVLSSAGHLAGL